MDWIRILSDGLRSGLGVNAAVYALAAVGLNLQYGFTGLWNFGQAGFLLVGGYGTAIAVHSWGLGLGWGVLVGVAAAVLLGLVLGLPTLRLRADYLAIVTISAAEILRIVVNSTSVQSVTGGPQGIKGFANSFFEHNPIPNGRYGIGSVTFTHRDLWVILVTWVIVALASLLVWLLVHSPWGRVVRAIREDEDAVRALGKNVFAFKMQALVIGGVLGALGGVVYALPSAVVPSDFVTSLTFFIWTILLLGGAATIFGPVIGAAIFWVLMAFLDNVLPQLAHADILPVTNIQAAVIRYIFVGIGLMLIVIFRPQGIFGNKKELTFVK
jgi:neutral amino acid transport system permease protein